MCFINSTGKIHIAKKPITCFKVLGVSVYYDVDRRVFVPSSKNYFGMVQSYFSYKFGYKNPEEDILVEQADLIACKEGFDYSVDKGYHSYMSKQAAFARAQSYIDLVNTRITFTGIAVAKFIIPEGSKYMSSLYYKEYVSSSIMLIEILTEALFIDSLGNKNTDSEHINSLYEIFAI